MLYLYLIQHDDNIYEVSTNDINKCNIMSIQVINPIKTKDKIYEKLSQYKTDNDYLQVENDNIIIREMIKHIVIQQTPKRYIQTPSIKKNKYELTIKGIDNTIEPEKKHFESFNKIVEYLNIKYKPDTPFNTSTITKLYKKEINYRTCRSPNKVILKRLEIIDI